MKKLDLIYEQKKDIIGLLKLRFDNNISKHKDINWLDIEKKLEINELKLWSLYQMELTGGEPNFFSYDKIKDEYIFYDCSIESPKGRRSLCYDKEALENRKENKPKGNVVDLADFMGVEILDEQEYKELQKTGNFDTKTSSWLKTPPNIRGLGGAIFGDYRFGSVFIYHNGADSYYSSRGFRSLIRL